MALQSLSLTNFRNHKKREVEFSKTTIIIGKNTVGKTNVLEAINYLSLGKSFKAEYEQDVILMGEEFARIDAQVEEVGDQTKLSIAFNNKQRISPKKYLVNDVARRATDFASHFTTVLFTPEDIDIISGSPGSRRRYVDSMLYKAHKPYRVAAHIYEKALKHRNRMLRDTREGKKRYAQQEFDYWDNLLIQHGAVVTEFRKGFVAFVQHAEKDIFAFDMAYDASLINESRLQKYYDAERGAGITLVGPQRDDFFFYYPGSENLIREYGSRGEQRLTLLQLKLFEIDYIRKNTQHEPTLLLDDIFSELDDKNIHKVFELLETQQTVLTTTHKEFIPDNLFKGNEISIIEL